MPRWAFVVIISAGVAVAAAACGEGDDAGDNGDGAPGPSPTVSADRRVVPAPIDELEIIIRESFPPQYAARIVSGLPDGCHRFDEAKVTSRSSARVEIEVTNTRPTDPNIACTAIYGQVETVVELGTGNDFVTGTEVTVRVNDTETKFTAQ